MKPQLRKFREAAKLTQGQVAKRIGVSQPHYHRWEAGETPIPEKQLAKLAKILKTTELAITGPKPLLAETKPRLAEGAEAFLAYFGEVAIHFCGGGEPLLLSIDEEEALALISDLQTKRAFVTVRSISNQTVAIRTDAIADLYVSADAVDTYGPEQKSYDSTYVQLALGLTTHDWEIVDAICNEIESGDSEDLEKFAPADVERVRGAVLINDKEYEQLVASGAIKAEDLQKEKAKNQVTTDLMKRLATTMTYQLSTGQRRTLEGRDPLNLYRAVSTLVEYGEDPLGDLMDGLIPYRMEGGYQTAFINPAALDYISVPTHKFEYAENNLDQLEQEEEERS